MSTLANRALPRSRKGSNTLKRRTSGSMSSRGVPEQGTGAALRSGLVGIQHETIRYPSSTVPAKCERTDNIVDSAVPEKQPTHKHTKTAVLGATGSPKPRWID